MKTGNLVRILKKLLKRRKPSSVSAPCIEVLTDEFTDLENEMNSALEKRLIEIIRSSPQSWEDSGFVVKSKPGVPAKPDRICEVFFFSSSSSLHTENVSG